MPGTSWRAWLRQHANEFGLTKEDGNPNEQGIEDAAKIANWDTKGGAPKTPGQPSGSDQLVLFASGTVKQMPLQLPDFPAKPECGGKQWGGIDGEHLPPLFVLVLIGRAKHAESVLAGTQRVVTLVPNALKEQLRRQLQTPSGTATYHRDGLLFEIISWIAARLAAAPNEGISTPHLKSTQQGLDTIKIGFDPVARNVARVVVYEQKCTEHPRDRFRDEVIAAFHEWKSHERDNQLIQAVTNLVERFELTDDEHLRLY